MLFRPPVRASKLIERTLALEVTTLSLRVNHRDRPSVTPKRDHARTCGVTGLDLLTRDKPQTKLTRPMGGLCAMTAVTRAAGG
jgi:hypothetical protein